MTKRLRTCLLLILLSALAATFSHAQTGERRPVASKVDEFGFVAGCDHSARLDNFAIELQNFPDHKGYLIAYGAEGEASGTAGFRLRLEKGYLVNARGIAEERIVTVYGGPYR